MKHGRHLRTPLFSDVRSVLSQYNTRQRLLHLLYDIEVMWRKTLKRAFPKFYTNFRGSLVCTRCARRVLEQSPNGTDTNKT